MLCKFIGGKLRCPYCGNEENLKVLKEWKFRFYDVKRIQCLKCNGIFNYYEGKSPKGKLSKFTIRVKRGK